MASRLCALAALLCLAMAPAAIAGEPVGFIAAVEGTVNIQPVAAADWQPAAIDNTVSLGDAISTGPGSSAKILLVDDTTLTLAGDTELVIDRMIVGDLATQERSILKQLRGRLRANVGARFGGTTRLEVHTPTAVAGVKGSTMDLLVRDETIACNFEGTMFVRNIDDSVGGEIDLPVGMCSRIHEGAAPEAPEVYPRDFPAIAPIKTQVASSTIDALIGAGGGVGAAGGALVGDVNVDLALVDPGSLGLGGSNTEATLDGGVESIPRSKLPNQSQLDAIATLSSVGLIPPSNSGGPVTVFPNLDIIDDIDSDPRDPLD